MRRRSNKRSRRPRPPAGRSGIVNDRFLRGCWREPVDCTPVWFMRQAGRSSPSYRAIRAKHGILEIAKLPDLAAEVTLQAVQDLGVDAAILFADLLLPIEAMGVRVRIDAGEGPVVEPPIRTPEDLDRLKPLDPSRDLPFVFETIRRVRAKPAVPCIRFGTGTAGFLESFAAAGGDVVGIDWRIPIDAAWRRIGTDRGIQGNLDPTALLSLEPVWRPAAEDVLRRVGGRPGHVFNLGHGVLPETRPDELRALVRVVHDSTRRG